MVRTAEEADQRLKLNFQQMFELFKTMDGQLDTQKARLKIAEVEGEIKGIRWMLG
jgi:hypothetical protein